VRTERWPGGAVFLMGGDVIAANTERDLERFRALLLSQGLADEAEIQEAQGKAGPGGDLGDELVRGGLVPGDKIMEARGQLFHDALGWLLLAPGAVPEFEPQDAVFPNNLQFGLSRDALLGDAETWLGQLEALVAALAEGSGRCVSKGSRPEGCPPDVWKALGRGMALGDLLRRLDPPVREAARRVSDWLDAGTLAGEDDEGAVEAAVEAPPTAKTGRGDDYERAARGEFIKSYEVKDKIDLSGVSAMHDHHAQGSESSIEAIEAVDLEHEEEAQAQAAAASPSTRPNAKAVRAVPPVHADANGDGGDDFDIFGGAEDSDGEVSGEAAPLEELDFVPEEGDDDSTRQPFEPLEDGAAVAEEDGAVSGSVETLAKAGPFSREQLQEFHDKVSVFNNIFRIIYRTFAAHMGSERARQRFNVLVSSSQRQYPELFADVKVEGDGAVKPSLIINNLAHCPAGDYATLLHQGLYELIFSHLYDAKDLLPSESETEMMEQIVVFERQLHAP
jgi:hypothetical protein